MSDARKLSDDEPVAVPAKPRPEADRRSILAKINARYANTLRYLGR